MSHQELDRVQVLRQLAERKIKARHAADQLNLSIRQIRRLLKTFRRAGAAGLISKQRGRPSNHQLDAATQQRALELLQTRYSDFGPTFAHEKLTEVHHLTLGRETVRHLMTGADLWHPHRAKKLVLHPLRERRARVGELIQIDGSPYAWFEDRAPACVLLVFVDDATSQLMELFFTDAESTFSYFEATEHYLLRHGKPQGLYSDKLSVFRVNLPNDLTGTGTTQFGRAMKQLNIGLLCANTPQAKGRVERANAILQDRLVKEMRLRGISSRAAGNAYLPEFITDYNVRFGVVPHESANAHRPLLASEDLARILTLQETRVLSKNLTLNYQNVIYQIQTSRPTYALRKATVLVRENRHGEIAIEYKGQPLAYTVYYRQVRQAEVVSSKQLTLKLDDLKKPSKKRTPYIPPANHPWRRFKLSKKTLQPNPPR